MFKHFALLTLSVFIVAAHLHVPTENPHVKAKIPKQLPPALEQAVRAAVTKCSAHTLEAADFLRILREARSDLRKDTEFQKLVFCILRATGFIDENGKIYVEKAASVFEDKEMKLVFEKCSKLIGNYPYETAYNGFKCYQSNTKYMIVL